MISKGASLKDERRERGLALRRRHIVETAAAEFAEKGFADAQVATIAQRAEVSLATVYAMFGTKDGLFQAVIETTGRAIREAVQARVEAVPPGRERLLVCIDALMDCFAESEDLFRIYVHGTHGLPWRIRQAMGDSGQAIFADFSHWLVGIARETRAAGELGSAHPEAVALALIGSVTTSVTAVVEGTAEADWPELAGGVRALFARILDTDPRERSAGKRRTRRPR
jgi:AcrR family transcriptional regulator